MGSVYFWTLLLIIVISGTVVTYKRCIKEKIDYAKIISVLIFFVIIIVISVITKAELLDYLKNTLYKNDSTDVNIITLYIFILLSGLYITFTLITEDLLKNISTFIDALLDLLEKIASIVKEILIISKKRINTNKVNKRVNSQFVSDYMAKWKSREESISIYKQIQKLYIKEGPIFNESFKVLDKGQREIFGELKGLDWTFYNFQIFVEMLTRFDRELKISKENKELIIQSFDDLSLSLKMICSGYYASGGIHLRNFYEKNINWMHNHVTGKFEKNCKIKVEEIFLKGQISYLADSTILKYPLNINTVYKIYKYLSNNYVHKGINNLEISFQKEKFIEEVILMNITIHLIARLINTAIGDDISNGPDKEKILNLVDDHPCYFSYIQRLFGFGILTNPETFLFNYVHDNKIAKELLLQKIGFSLEDICSDEYLRSHKEFKVEENKHQST